ncbi:flagellar brake protein [Sulfurirhabdus autotrophica]|uniref:PilZ domain-containing protein n=1 Tax=Sulfurirhabdus autotrophica TaxID=1706046 RepID=A0A4R3Y820_9PROT|nr:flagellar brake protein [Sulfurirhabdus autotrophica]TCV86714.1 PilZ domain-containing protein [Sulfurirhabdus autotrophica]
MGSEGLVPLKISDINIGKPLPWPVYDSDRNLLLREGFIIENQRQIELLSENGLFRNPGWKKSAINIGTNSKQEQEEKDKAKLATTENLQGTFVEMKPNVGDPFQIQVSTSFGDERYSVKLLGYLPNGTVMVSAPEFDGHLVLCRENQNVIVRSFSGTAAFGFSSSIRKVCNTPISYLHLVYPKTVQKVSVRESARISFNIIGTVTNLNVGENSPGFPVSVVDVSTTGAAFVTNKKVAEKDDELRLTFKAKIKDIEVYPVLNCIVRSSTLESSESGVEKYRFGIQFKDLPTQELLILQSMVYQKMLEKK